MILQIKFIKKIHCINVDNKQMTGIYFQIEFDYFKKTNFVQI